MKHSFQIWMSVTATSGDDTFCTYFAGGSPNPPINPFVELLYWLTGRCRHTFPSIGASLVEKIPSSAEDDAEMRKLRDSLLQELEELLGNDGVFIYPTHPRPAPYHNETVLTPFNCGYTGIFNVLGVPVTAVPMGLAPKEEVPTGIQVVASRYCDRLTLAVAVELEKACGGWVPPFKVSS